MTDEQLAVLLKNNVRLLEGALQKTKDKLPDDYKEEFNTFLGTTFQMYPILQPIEDVIHDMKEDTEILLGEE